MNLQIQTQSLSTHFPLPPFPPKPKFLQAKPKPSFKLWSSLSTVSVPPTKTSHKPFPAEVSRTIMELSSIGTLSTLAQDGWPLGVGVRFAVDAEGTPVLCLPQPSPDNRSTLHVQLDQCGLRTPQCTIQGSLTKPADATILRDSILKLILDTDQTGIVDYNNFLDSTPIVEALSLCVCMLVFGLCRIHNSTC
ncbi:hypothetical protein ES332_D05G124000v1 [Gossypium tomentosum]|uniref:Uncharacterized protein n=1 Tax=Gossypium tomentosum TaxID=34277 RepID=A0A5D2KUL0_GOSTO|nr:hypothetical protein ES332_D05G124000v1 [Gossypium tomentosum]